MLVAPLLRISRRPFASLPTFLALALVALSGCSTQTSSRKSPVPSAVESKTTEPSHEPPALYNPPKEVSQVAEGAKGAVTSAEANASNVGVDILRKGGNAVDAAIATAFALGVTHPSAGNIGGGGFMVIRFADGTSTALDYREVAPMNATADMFLDPEGDVSDKSTRGPLAAGIPGVVAGLWMAHKLHGSLPWSELVQPAIELARHGWYLDEFHAEDLQSVASTIRERLDKMDTSVEFLSLVDAMHASLQVFEKAPKVSYEKGDLWKQPDLADTLEAIAKDGQSAFYRGPIASEMASKVQAMGGIWQVKDLADYEPKKREPIVFDYKGNTLITMPPPSAGGIVLRQILEGAEVTGLAKHPWDSAERIHLYIEILRRVYADRNELVGDPDFVKVPLETLLDETYIASRMSNISRNRATPSSEIKAGLSIEEESEETTHFSVVDENGVSVSNTFTLNGRFGAKLQIPGTGVTLNNEMDDFTSKPGAPNMFGLVQGKQNAVAPGKRMLSSMTPTIIARNGKVRAVLGSPGGPTISTTVAQIALQLLDYERPIEDAIAATRIHQQWLPDMVFVEKSLSDELSSALKSRGHTLVPRSGIGHANCIEVTPGGSIRAVADSTRDGGKASAY